MIKKIVNIFFLFLFIIFIFLISKYYFSDKNIILTNKKRSNYSLKVLEESKEIPILENDTNDIIVYKNDLEQFKMKSKKRFWNEGRILSKLPLMFS